MCDVVHALLLEQIERRTLADRQGLLASGVRESLPEVHEECARFEAALVEEPAPLTQMGREQLELRRALGVA